MPKHLIFFGNHNDVCPCHGMHKWECAEYQATLLETMNKNGIQDILTADTLLDKFEEV